MKNFFSYSIGHTRGFTLIELMITVALLGILVALAMPSFSDLMRRTKIESAASNVMVSLATARNEAVKRGRNVSICSSTDGTNCSGSNNWATGWLIYSSAGTPIKVFDALQTGISVVGDATHVQHQVTFTSSGSTTLGGAGNITICMTGQTSRVVDIAVSGRARVALGGSCP